MNCDPQSLVNQANALCAEAQIPPGMEMPVLIALFCQLANASSGGTGTVTSFSAGNLSPLFTASVATATTTPALSFALNTQTANTLFAGPTTGAAAAPTFRAMVNADLGTTLTPQFARVGLGVAAAAATSLNCLQPSIGANVPCQIAQFTCTTSDPYISVGEAVNDSGGYIIFARANNSLAFAVFGHVGMEIYATGNLYIPGVYISNGFSGVTGTFDATNTVTVTGGIITQIV